MNEEGEEVVTGRAELVEADFAAAATRLPQFRRGLTQLWLWPLLVIAFMSIHRFLNQGDSSLELLPLTLPVVFAIALALVFRRLTHRAWIKQAQANQGGNAEFRFDDFGFGLESPLRQHRLAWASLAHWVETPEAFVIYTTPRTLLLVPKRAFSSQSLDRVRELLASRITTKEPAGSAFGSFNWRKTLLLWLILVLAFLGIWHWLDQPSPREVPARRAPTSTSQ